MTTDPADSPGAESGAAPTPTSEAGGRRALLLVLLLALLSGGLKLALIGPSAEGLPAVDERLYLHGAESLAETGTASYRNPNWDEAHASPVQPHLMAWCYERFGSEGYPAAVRTVHVLLSTLSVLLLYALARRAFGVRVALWGAGLTAFYPALVAYSQYFFTETTYIFFALASALALVPKEGTVSPLRALGAGVLGGLAALTRSVFVAQVPVLGLWFLFGLRGSLGRRLAAFGLFIAGAALVVAPWSVHNTNKYGAFLLIDSNGGNVLHKNLNAVRPENHDLGQIALRHQELKTHDGTPPFRERVEVEGIAERNSAEVRAALAYALQYPGTYLRNTGIRLAELLNPTSTLVRKVRTDRYPELGAGLAEAIVLVSLVATMAALLLGLVGLLERPRDGSRSLMLAFIVGHVLVCVLIASGSRYRLPIMPFLIPFAVHGFLVWRAGKRPPRLLLIPLALGLVATWAHYLPFSFRSEAEVREDALAPGANVVLISIDSLRADHLSCYGYERKTSPAIDALAAEGTLFEHNVAQAPWTLPSHASMLTSLYPRAHQATDGKRRLARKVNTMARMFQRNGYATMAVVSGPFMQVGFGLQRGFDHYDDTIASGGHKQSHRAITSPDIHAKAVQVLDGRPEGPFFLFLHYWDVHYDYQPPPPYDTLFDPDYTGSISNEDFIRNEAITADMDPRDLEHVVAQYDGEIAFVDAYIRMLIEELKARDLYEDTILVLTSDHGDEFFEHGEKGHQHSLYQELVHTPLIVRIPGQAGGRRVAQRVQTIDVMPTVAELLGFDIPAHLHGRSIVPLLLGQELEDLPAITQTTKTRKSREDPERSDSWSVYTGDWKWIQFDGERYPPELYDLARDPLEQNNLAPSQDVAAFRTLLEDWMRRTPEREVVEHEGVSRKTRDDLRGLGYVGDDEDG